MIDWVSLALYAGGIATGFALANYRPRKTVADVLAKFPNALDLDVRVESAVDEAIEMDWSDTPSSLALGTPEDDELVPMLSFEDPATLSNERAMRALDAPGILDRLRYARNAGAVVTGISWLPYRCLRGSEDECENVEQGETFWEPPK